jgi:GntR family transcriptional regulator
MTGESIQLHIEPGDELPIYRQLMRQITDAVAGGRLSPGCKLPSQRDLAEQLVISPLTVKKAYDELERLGVICTQRGRGTFVSTSVPAVDPAEQRQRLRGAVRVLLTQAHLSRVPFTELVSLLEEVHQELQVERAEQQQAAQLAPSEQEETQP